MRQPLAVPANGSVSIPDLDPGVHTVTLAGLAGNCALTTPAPLEVTVPGAAGAVANVEITCTAIYTLAYRGESGVELTDAAGTVHRTLVPGDADPLAWSPDGRLLAVSKNDNGVSESGSRIWTTVASASSRLSASDSRLASVGAWSPDGRELLLETIALEYLPNRPDSLSAGRQLPASKDLRGILGMTGGVACS